MFQNNLTGTSRFHAPLTLFVIEKALLLAASQSAQLSLPCLCFNRFINYSRINT